MPGVPGRKSEKDRRAKSSVIETRGDEKRLRERVDLMRTKQVGVEAYKNLSRWQLRILHENRNCHRLNSRPSLPLDKLFQCPVAIPLVSSSLSQSLPTISRASRVLSSLLLPTTRPGVVLVLAFRGERTGNGGIWKERLVFRRLLS